MTALVVSIERHDSPYPFIHACVRSTAQRIPTWIGVGTPLLANASVKPNPSSTVRLGRLSKA